MTELREPFRRLMTAREVAEYCRVGPETVRRWVRVGKLTPAGQVPGGRYLFDLAAVDAFLGITMPRTSVPSDAQPTKPVVRALTLSTEEVDRHVDRAYEHVMRESLRGRGMTDAEIEKEFARRKKHRDATRKAMNDPELKRRMRESRALYWADPENRKKHAEAMRRRGAARTRETIPDSEPTRWSAQPPLVVPSPTNQLGDRGRSEGATRNNAHNATPFARTERRRRSQPPP